MRQLKAPNPLLVFILIGILVIAAAGGILLNASYNLDGQGISPFPELITYPPSQDTQQFVYPPPSSLLFGN